MKRNAIIYVCLLFYALALQAQKQSEIKPNVLFMLTDDQRYDGIRAFNQMLHNREMSELGYVESPNVDRLAKMGTTFINTYCQAQGCAPSRASMHYGRYPFRSGIYEFEYHNNNAEHCQPTLPEQMAKLGYQTLRVGKLGVRVKTIVDGKVKPHQIYQVDIDKKHLAREGMTDWGSDWFGSFEGERLEKPMSGVVFTANDNNEIIYLSEEVERRYPKYKGTQERISKEHDLLHIYKPNEGKNYTKMVLAGESPRKAGETRDGFIASTFINYLNNTEDVFKIGKYKYEGIDMSKPLFCQLGFTFPHTPVIPPKEYRDRFQKHTYKVPTYETIDKETMPKQLKNIIDRNYTDHFTDEEKQAMIRDYYAFCAYGDDLVGQAADAFIAHSEKQNKPWMIVYVCGDHGWKLNEHGSVSKFSPWEIDCHNPIIVVSSDKKKFPAGKVVRDFTEFVDIAPTIIEAGGAKIKSKEYDYLDGMDLKQIAKGKAPKRDYVIGESHAVIGPRAYIRTKDYVFSMQTRPNKNRGEQMDWARTASYEDLDPGLYDTNKDPKEINNLAFDKEYEAIAQAMKKKLIDIVLGDQRVEVEWGKKADGTVVHYGNFAIGAHDYKLKLKK